MKAIAAGIVTVVLFTGCSSSAPPPTTTTPLTFPPRTEQVTLPTLPEPATTAPVATLPTPSTLPFGLTEADRTAVEAAAKAWWDEWNRQILALPKFDPNGFFELAEPGSPAAASNAVLFEKLAKEGVAAIAPTINEVVVLSVEFKGDRDAEAVTCTANDGGIKKVDTGEVVLPAQLDRGRNLLTFRKTGGEWLLATETLIGTDDTGKSCADSF